MTLDYIKSARSKAGIARTTAMSPEERTALARKGAAARWGKPKQHDSAVPPCLVWVRGTRGAEPQVWYEPMVDERGNVRVAPEGVQVIGKPVQLPPRSKGQPAWTPDEAAELVKKQAA